MAGGGAVIGHVLGDGIALFAAEGDSGMAVGAYRLVQEHIRRAGQPWNHTWHAVGRYLREGGWLAAHEPERFTIRTDASHPDASGAASIRSPSPSRK
jgi:hypothetical protein